MSISFEALKKPSPSKPMYRITASYQNGVLSVYVFDSSSGNKWRSEFTQNNFPQFSIFDVARSLIDAINGMKSDDVNFQHKTLSIMEYCRWCYVSIKHSKFPTFACRPMLVVKQKQVDKDQKARSRARSAASAQEALPQKSSQKTRSRGTSAASVQDALPQKSTQLYFQNTF